MACDPLRDATRAASRLQWGSAESPKWVVADLLRVLREVVRVFFSSVRDMVRYVFIPVAALILAAGRSASFAWATLRCLDAGSLTDLLALVGFGVIAAVALTLIWLALCGLPLAQSWQPMIWFVGTGGGLIAVLIAIGGWIIGGVISMFAHGPIHVGWLTISTTALLVMAYFMLRIRQATDVVVAGGATASDDTVAT